MTVKSKFKLLRHYNANYFWTENVTWFRIYIKMRKELVFWKMFVAFKYLDIL